jgi:hypothetical protein
MPRNSICQKVVAVAAATVTTLSIGAAAGVTASAASVSSEVGQTQSTSDVSTATALDRTGKLKYCAGVHYPAYVHIRSRHIPHSNGLSTGTATSFIARAGNCQTIKFNTLGGRNPVDVRGVKRNGNSRTGETAPHRHTDQDPSGSNHPV